MQKFIRFGIVPKNEKSINWFKLSFDQQDDISYWLENGCTLEQALETEKLLNADIFEAGVSAFICVNGMPQIDNLQQLISLNSRMHDDVYIFDGDIVAYGSDNEPLVQNISNIQKINIDSLVEYTESILKANYSEIKKADYVSTKISATNAFISITGENVLESVTFNGNVYMCPIPSWNTKRGVNAFR